MVFIGKVVGKTKMLAFKRFFGLLLTITSVCIITCAPNGPIERSQLYIVNATGYTLYNLYVAPVASDDFGKDQLPSEIKPSKDSWVKSIEPGLYRIKIRSLEGQCTILDSITLKKDSVKTITLVDSVFSRCQAGYGTIKILNSTSERIYYVNIRPYGTLDWGPDILDSKETVSINGGKDIFNYPSGIYDIRVQTRLNLYHQQLFKQTLEPGSIIIWNVTSLL